VTSLFDGWAELLEPGVLGFVHPLWIAIVGIAAFALWLRSVRRAHSAFSWPALAEAREVGRRGGDPLEACLSGFRLAALAALVLGVAGPVRYGATEPERRRGLDLVLAVDASGSMRALDARLEGEPRRRLDLAREAVARFAVRRVGDGDRVGLVVFGDSAFTLCPLTSDGALLVAALDRVEAGMAGEATALGDALALAVKRAAGGSPEAVAGDPPGAPRPGRPAAGRVVVLLSDGRSNAGAVPTDIAAALARSTATRVHTVGIGASGEVAMAHRKGPGREIELERHDLDRETLRQIAAASGGHYFEAQSSGDLRQVYQAIDGLERIARDAPSRTLARPASAPFLAAASVLLLLEISLGRVFWRRIP
jgi:Ca-activated chloride channel family protein